VVKRALKRNLVGKQRKKRSNSATLIQAVYRGHLQRKQFEEDRARVVAVQALARKWLVLREMRRRKASATEIQRIFRGHRDRKATKIALRRVVLIQANIRRSQ